MYGRRLLQSFGLTLGILCGIARMAHATPPTITFTCTVYNVDSSLAGSNGTPAGRVTISNLYTQNIGGAVIRPSSQTLITNSSGVTPSATFIQGEAVTVQVDRGPSLSATFPSQPTIDCSSLLNVASNASTPPATIPVAPSNGGTGCSSPNTVANLPVCNSTHNLDICGVSNSLNTCVAGNSLVDGGTSGNPCIVVCNGGTGTWNILESAPGTGFANPMTTLGDTMYENATPAATRLAGNTTTEPNVYTQTGTGTVSAAPGWTALNAIPKPVVTNSSSPTDAASLTIDWSVAAGFFVSILTTNTTVTFSNQVKNQRIVIEFQQAAAGGPFTVTWPAGVKWLGGSAPTMTATASKKDMANCLYDGTDTLCIADQNF